MRALSWNTRIIGNVGLPKQRSIAITSELGSAEECRLFTDATPEADRPHPAQ